jgi:hypothetical protein
MTNGRKEKPKVGAMVATQVDGVDMAPIFRRVAHSGSARYLSVTQQIPKDWRMVELTVVSLKDNICLLQVRKVA